MVLVIKLQAEQVWQLNDAIEDTDALDDETADRIERMANDESLWDWSTSDPRVRDLCDAFDIAYEILPD